MLPSVSLDFFLSLPHSHSECVCMCACVNECVHISVCPFVFGTLVSFPGSFLLCSTPNLTSCFSFSSQFPGKTLELH